VAKKKPEPPRKSTPSNNPTVAKRAAPLTRADRYRLYSQVLDLFKLVIWFVGLSVIVALFITLPTYYSAGKQTSLNVVYKAVADFKLHMILPYAIAAVFGELWRRERNTRKSTVEREHRRVAELEMELDRRRESSTLTPRGDTPKGLQ